MGVVGAVSDPTPHTSVWLLPDTAIISFDILLYFQHIARVRDLGCFFSKGTFRCQRPIAN